MLPGERGSFLCGSVWRRLSLNSWSHVFTALPTEEAKVTGASPFSLNGLGIIKFQKDWGQMKNDLPGPGPWVSSNKRPLSSQNALPMHTHPSFLEIPFYILETKAAEISSVKCNLLLIQFWTCFSFMVLEMELRTLRTPGQRPVLEPSLHVSESQGPEQH